MNKHPWIPAIFRFHPAPRAFTHFVIQNIQYFGYRQRNFEDFSFQHIPTSGSMQVPYMDPHTEKVLGPLNHTPKASKEGTWIRRGRICTDILWIDLHIHIYIYTCIYTYIDTYISIHMYIYIYDIYYCTFISHHMGQLQLPADPHIGQDAVRCVLQLAEKLRSGHEARQVRLTPHLVLQSQSSLEKPWVWRYERWDRSGCINNYVCINMYIYVYICTSLYNMHP